MDRYEWWLDCLDEPDYRGPQRSSTWSILVHLKHWQLESATPNEIVFNNKFWSELPIHKKEGRIFDNRRVFYKKLRGA